MRLAVKNVFGGLLDPINDRIAADPHLLEYRANILDERMKRSPEGMANEVKHALINQLKEQAPWLIPEVI